MVDNKGGVFLEHITACECETNDTDGVQEDDVRIVDFPQHLLNASLRTSSSVHE